jgi:hypothetical protein
MYNSSLNFYISDASLFNSWFDYQIASSKQNKHEEFYLFFIFLLY